MNDATLLATRLDRVARRYRWLALWRGLAACWAAAALVGATLVWITRAAGWTSPLTVAWFVALAGGAATAVAIRQWLREPDPRWLARRLERAFPELNGVLLTAVQQRSDSRSDFLVARVLQQANVHSHEHDWPAVVPPQRLWGMLAVQCVALGCFVAAAVTLQQVAPKARHAIAAGPDGVVVTPGDSSIERGETLVVLARFERRVPTEARLVLRESGAAPRSLPLARALSDPVFGGTIADVRQDFTYRLEYGSERTREFRVTAFEAPRLVRADAALTFPDYTRLAPKRIPDTRRLSAVEGTRIDLTLQLNKPVATARLVARDEKKTVIPLVVARDQPTATLEGWAPTKSQTFDLQLTDADGRANKISTPFVVDVQPNRPPELRVASPRGDVRPSALEELSFAGTVWDDFGTRAFGLTYAINGAAPKSVEFGHGIAAREKKEFSFVLRLEELGAKPDDVIAWHVWAEDAGPDGNVRRTDGDLFFAEVRPFDEVFRESQGMPSGDDASSQGQGNETRRLAELQKQIISATWKLQRNAAAPNYGTDHKVVRDAQEQALEQAREGKEGARSLRDQSLWQTATQEMERAIDRLAKAARQPKELAQALPPEQAAYRMLLQLQARETSVTRGQRGRSGAGGQAGNQRQIDQLDLQQAENRYETQRQARAPQNEERREQLAVMNRLKELAQRQQDINERLKELQTALQGAHSEPEREELRKRLKRLEEEQRRMLADADEVRQRMDRPANQSQMETERQQMDRTRDDLQRAADAAGQGSVAQALAAGTRAERQLQQTREGLRQQSASQFADDLREMRSEARELSRQQEELQRKIGESREGATQRKSLSDAGNHSELVDEVTEQQERMEKLVGRATQISEQAENSEPLLAKQLYDTVRKQSQDDAGTVNELRTDLVTSGELTFDLQDRLQKAAQREGSGKALELTAEMLKEGNLRAAGRTAERAGAQADALRRGVERAAESVLGDEAEQLRLAQSELDQLTDQLRREMTDAQSRDPNGASNRRTPPNSTAASGPRSPEAGARDTASETTNGETPTLVDAEGRRPEGGAAPSSAGENRGASRDAQANRGQMAGEPPNRDTTGGGRRGRVSVDSLLENPGAIEGGGGGDGLRGSGPLAGDSFAPWTERLRDVEQLLDAPDLRDAVANARERMRLLRRDVTQAGKKPDWATVQLEVVKPLVEVRNRVAEELARRDTSEPLAPIDHDPVPTRFAESVRRYYEELGKDK